MYNIRRVLFRAAYYITDIRVAELPTQRAVTLKNQYRSPAPRVYRFTRVLLPKTNRIIWMSKLF